MLERVHRQSSCRPRRRRIEFCKHTLHALKDLARTAYHERPAYRLGRDADGALGAALGRPGQGLAGDELPERARRRIELGALDAVGPHLKVIRNLLLVELRHELLESGEALHRRINDQRVRRRIRAHNDLARLFQVRPRPPARIDRHGRLGIHLVDYTRQFLSTRHLERKHPDLPPLGIERLGLVQFIHNRLDLRKHVRMR